MTPQNAGYYHAAYIIAVVLYGSYAVSIWVRRRAIRRRGGGTTGSGR